MWGQSATFCGLDTVLIRIFSNLGSEQYVVNLVPGHSDGKEWRLKIMLEAISVGSNPRGDKFASFWGRTLVVISVDLTSNPGHPGTFHGLPGSNTEGSELLSPN
ncbi:hypothetical protein Acr_16g0008850 [Actinidia rufa]|uniref:Uncharacterized protein n=1 Tax=Actinidia rufa TaxID=165716 RepID=A0A7J0FZZ1_9ERIC|nr:hypothetical protein Acr_16g0008800 [Actinidia rufa]GFZ04261.1 hypothetical protein Acr_16g0008850 [Actinidia rufa]